MTPQQSELFNLLKLLKHVTTCDRSIELEVRKCLSDEKQPAVIQHKEWTDRHMSENPELFPLDLSKPETWCTYLNLIDFRFVVGKKDNKLHCNVTLWDGDNFNGQRTSIRWIAELILPDSFIEKIQEDIDYKLKDFLEDLYDKHLETKKRMWIEKQRKAIIDSFQETITSKS